MQRKLQFMDNNSNIQICFFYRIRDKAQALGHLLEMEKTAPSSSSLLLSPQVTLVGKPERMGNGHDMEGAHNSGHDHHSWNIV
jgi:hypothetical protein